MFEVVDDGRGRAHMRGGGGVVAWDGAAVLKNEQVRDASVWGGENIAGGKYCTSEQNATVPVQTNDDSCGVFAKKVAAFLVPGRETSLQPGKHRRAATSCVVERRLRTAWVMDVWTVVAP